MLNAFLSLIISLLTPECMSVYHHPRKWTCYCCRWDMFFIHETGDPCVVVHKQAIQTLTCSRCGSMNRSNHLAWCGARIPITHTHYSHTCTLSLTPSLTVTMPPSLFFCSRIVFYFKYILKSLSACFLSPPLPLSF